MLLLVCRYVMVKGGVTVLDGKISFCGNKRFIKHYLKCLVKSREFEILNISKLYQVKEKEGKYKIHIFGSMPEKQVSEYVYGENRKMVRRYWQTGNAQYKRRKPSQTNRQPYGNRKNVSDS